MTIGCFRPIVAPRPATILLNTCRLSSVCVVGCLDAMAGGFVSRRCGGSDGIRTGQSRRAYVFLVERCARLFAVSFDVSRSTRTLSYSRRVSFRHPASGRSSADVPGFRTSLFSPYIYDFHQLNCVFKMATHSELRLIAWIKQLATRRETSAVPVLKHLLLDEPRLWVFHVRWRHFIRD